MKQVFIFVGDPATGKTVLGNLINANAIVFDDFLPHLANEFDSERLKYYDYAIYITNNPKNVILTYMNSIQNKKEPRLILFVRRGVLPVYKKNNLIEPKIFIHLFYSTIHFVV